MLRRIVFFVLFPILCGLSATTQEFSVGPIPSWVKECPLPEKEAPLESIDGNVQHILVDVQKNWAEKTSYFRYVMKPLTKNGIEDVAQIHIDFDPAFEKPIVHKIQVYRSGKRGDRLEKAFYQVIQRETDAEQNIYDGKLSLVYILKDIREGDIIEYSYSVIGEPPIFSSHFWDIFYFQWKFPIATVFYRLLVPTQRYILTKSFNFSSQPIVTQLSGETTEWQWKEYATKAISHEKNAPDWFYVPSRIQLSDCISWREVALALTPFYSLPENWETDVCPDEMKNLIHEWKGESGDPKQQALLALRFVQDKIRYLGMEIGINNWKPHDPKEVLENRFGDCKDKAFLLQTFLRLLQIPSDVVLVDTKWGKNLKDSLPGMFFFNHVVLRIHLNHTYYWVDPTLSLQGGSLSTNVFPNYEWGLVISKDTMGLTACVGSPQTIPVKIDSTYVITSESEMEWKVKKILVGEPADNLRRSYHNKGLRKLSEYYLSEVKNTYETAKIAKPLQLVDDRDQNRITTIVSYNISSKPGSEKKRWEIYSFILNKYLHSSVRMERSSPLDLSYPLWIKERIQIENFAADKPIEEDRHSYEHPSMAYEHSFASKGKRSNYYYELEHLKDHVSVEDFSEYRQVVHQILEDLPADENVSIFETTQ